MTSLLATLAALCITALSAAGLAPALLDYNSTNIFHLFLSEFMLCLVALIITADRISARKKASRELSQAAA